MVIKSYKLADWISLIYMSFISDTFVVCFSWSSFADWYLYLSTFSRFVTETTQSKFAICSVSWALLFIYFSYKCSVNIAVISVLIIGELYPIIWIKYIISSSADRFWLLPLKTLLLNVRLLLYVCIWLFHCSRFGVNIRLCIVICHYSVLYN